MDKTGKFVIQRHERKGEPTHWDLMLEAGDCLETYRTGVAPAGLGEEPVEAIRIFDHPLRFLSYEGAVNKGKGVVKIADSGTYEVMCENEAPGGYGSTGRL